MKKKFLIVFIMLILSSIIEIGVFNFNGFINYFLETKQYNLSDFEFKDFKIINKSMIISTSDDPWLEIKNADRKINSFLLDIDFSGEIINCQIFYDIGGQCSYTENLSVSVTLPKKSDHKYYFKSGCESLVKNIRFDLTNKNNHLIKVNKIIVNPSEINFSLFRFAVIFICQALLVILIFKKIFLNSTKIFAGAIIFLIAVSLIWFIIHNTEANSSKIVHYTNAYDAFTGWDWMIDSKTNMAMGMPKSGILSDYQLKIHPINEKKPNEWNEGEYFCDPDSMIAVYSDSTQDVKYLPYLKWNKDYFISKDQKWGRFSMRYLPENGNKSFASGSTLQLSIREDHTIEAGTGYEKTVLYIKNLYKEKIDIVYIYQDSAYMWLPDKNQDNVRTVGRLDSEIKSNIYFFSKWSNKFDFAGTYHKDKTIFGGLFTTQQNCYLGIIPEYAFFKKHLSNSILKGLGYADIMYKKTPAELVQYLSQWNGDEIKKSYLKNRIIMFDFYGIEPGKEAIIQFYRVGYNKYKDMDDLKNEITDTINNLK